MKKDKRNRTRKGLAGVAAILTFTGFMSIVTTATANENVQISRAPTPDKVKLASGVVSLIAAASLLTLRDVKFNQK